MIKAQFPSQSEHLCCWRPLRPSALKKWREACAENFWLLKSFYNIAYCCKNVWVIYKIQISKITNNKIRFFSENDLFFHDLFFNKIKHKVVNDPFPYLVSIGRHSHLQNLDQFLNNSSKYLIFSRNFQPIFSHKRYLLNQMECGKLFVILKRLECLYPEQV